MMLAPTIDSHVNTFGGKEVSLGIDEAGRGCVLGAMVYACFYCTEEGEKVLKGMKVDENVTSCTLSEPHTLYPLPSDMRCDSKKLTEEQREAHFETFEKMKAHFGWRIHAISPQEISARMLQRPKISLNEISHNTAEALIRETCKAGVNVKKAFVDTVGSATSYQAHLQKLFPSIKITVREKADSLFPVVSAASILAKVTRDRRLKQWKVSRTPLPHAEASEEPKEESLSAAFGSGYPGDQVTIDFLHSSMDKVFGFPPIVRWSWETAKNIFNKEGVPVDWYDEVEDKSSKSTSKITAKAKPQQSTKQSRITSFFQSKPQGAPCIERPHLLIKHRIDLITAASNI